MKLLEMLHGWIHNTLPQCDANVELHEGLVLVSSADVTIELHPEYVDVFAYSVRSMRIGRNGFFLSGRKIEFGHAIDFQSANRGSINSRTVSGTGYSILFRQSVRNWGEDKRITVDLELERLCNEFPERLSATAVFYEQNGVITAEKVCVNDVYRLCTHLKKAITNYIKAWRKANLCNSFM